MPKYRFVLSSWSTSFYEDQGRRWINESKMKAYLGVTCKLCLKLIPKTSDVMGRYKLLVRNTETGVVHRAYNSGWGYDNPMCGVLLASTRRVKP